ncbi:MAG: hypothetical protein AAGI71_16185 [Bacteroidota bacterium]
MAPPESSAQSRPGRLAFGLQVGTTSGLTVRIQPGSVGLNVQLGTSTTAGSALHLHTVLEQRFADSPLHRYLGLGLGLGHRPGSDPARQRLELSFSALVGVNFFLNQFDVHIKVMPRLVVSPELEPVLDRGVGIRYYLRPRSP